MVRGGTQITTNTSVEVLSKTDASSTDPGIALMCGCAACVAARHGDTSAFEAAGYQRPPVIQPQASVIVTLVSPVSLFPATAPAYAIDAVANPWGAKWGNSTIGASATVTFSFLTSVPELLLGQRGRARSLRRHERDAAAGGARCLCVFLRSCKHHLRRSCRRRRLDQSRDGRSRQRDCRLGLLSPHRLLREQ